MADYGKSNPKLNKKLQAILHDDWFYDGQHQFVNYTGPAFLNRNKLEWFANYLNSIGFIAQVIDNYPDNHPKQANAYFQGMKKAYDECGRPCEIAAVVQKNPETVKRAQRLIVLVPNGLDLDLNLKQIFAVYDVHKS